MLSSSSSVDTNGTKKKIGNVDNNIRENDYYLAYAADPDRLAIPIPVAVTIPKLATVHDHDEKVESLESQVSKITL